MTCLSITQWSLPNFYSLQGIIHVFLSRETWQARRAERFIERLGGGDKPHIDSAALGVMEYIITVDAPSFWFNSIGDILPSREVSAPAVTHY